MRLQGMSIVFALVSLPIILVIAYYISLQIDTINLQSQYNANLLDATYDSLSAFELNTANEDLSTVSDSLRTIIEASSNIFMNTLSTNFGMSNASKSHLEPFIPAVLYTLYDGYYIYAPTYAPTVITDSDGNAVSVGSMGVTANADGTYAYTEYVKKYDTAGRAIDPTEEEKKNNMINYDNANFKNKMDYGQLLYYTKNTVKTDNTDGGVSYTNCTASIEPAKIGEDSPTKAEYTTKNVLKSYIPYSARYVQNIKDSEGQDCLADINAIYTLDNYLTIEGSFSYDGDNATATEIYWTKSGYLLPFTQETAEGEKGKLSVRVTFDINSATPDYEKPLKYNQNEIEEYIEAGKPIRIEALKSIYHPEDGYEEIITINDSNKAIIDKSNTNTESDSAKLIRYENALFDLEELIAKIKKGVIVEEKVVLEKQEPDGKDEDGNPKFKTVRTENGNAIYNALLVLGNESEFTNYRDKSPTELYNYIDSQQLVKSIREGLINPTKYRMQLNSAAVYYAKAAIFSNWVKDNLSELKISSIEDISGLNYTTYTEELANEATGNKYNYLNLWKNDGKVFDFTSGKATNASTEITQDSPFYTHKLTIIRASIQYNLNLSMSAYNRHLYYDDSQTYALNKNTDYTMPIMKESEWEQILSNISIVSFMQGLQCGLKQFNNYVVVSSSNNEIMTSPDNVYYAKSDEFNNETSEYHKYNCKKVYDSLVNNSGENTKRISFTSKEVKYDKISTRSAILPYTYDHKNLACYECINDGNYRGADIFNIKSSDEEKEKNAKWILRKAFYIGIAKERNDVYKMNAVKNSEGYEILYFNGPIINSSILINKKNSKLEMNKVKRIEVTFGAVDTERRDEASLTFSIQYKTSPGSDVVNLKNIYNTSDSMLYSIPTNTTNKYTWDIEVEPTLNDDAKFDLDKLIFTLQNSAISSFTGDIKNSIVAIRMVYK